MGGNPDKTVRNQSITVKWDGIQDRGAYAGAVWGPVGVWKHRLYHMVRLSSPQLGLVALTAYDDSVVV